MKRFRMDGPIVNLAASKGLTEDQATNLLSTISRVHLTEAQTQRQKALMAQKIFNPCREVGIERIGEDNPLYHSARRRIITIENAISRLKSGEDHGLKRKKLRKDKRDAETILATLIHVLSRRAPKTSEEKIEDARLLLVRTKEIEDYRYTKTAPPTFLGKAGLSIEISASEIKLDKCETDQIILHNSPVGQLRIQMKHEVPESFKQKVISLCEKGALAAEVIDWDGLQGVLPATLQTARDAPYYVEHNYEGSRFEIIVDTGFIQRDENTGIIYPHPPGRTKPIAAPLAA